MDLQSLGKTLVFFGVILVGLGLLLTIVHKVPFLGRLPGDIYVKRENFTFYFPLATSLVISVVLSLVLWLFSRR